MLMVLTVMMLYIFSDCCYASPNMPPRMLVYTAVLAEFCAPTLIPLVWMYQMRLRGQGRFTASQMLWLFIPATLGSITLLLTVMAGPDRIQADRIIDPLDFIHFLVQENLEFCPRHVPLPFPFQFLSDVGFIIPVLPPFV